MHRISIPTICRRKTGKVSLDFEPTDADGLHPNNSAIANTPIGWYTLKFIKNGVAFSKH
ncbi:MAG: hypothetical protein IT244_13325 [Bacteroidia bacterium]|nr:hypothetical protein [Bacteroidia bacterium]